jgi:hypothetical protein
MLVLWRLDAAGKLKEVVSSVIAHSTVLGAVGVPPFHSPSQSAKSSCRFAGIVIVFDCVSTSWAVERLEFASDGNVTC